jgi:hypothetical protein
MGFVDECQGKISGVFCLRLLRQGLKTGICSTFMGLAPFGRLTIRSLGHFAFSIDPVWHDEYIESSVTNFRQILSYLYF